MMEKENNGRLQWWIEEILSNSLDACHSISRNISEGYCRKSIKEYLNFLNIRVGSSGEFHSTYYSFYKAKQITEDEYEKLDKLHYKTENQLIKLIEKLQEKKNDESWKDEFV
ncbi:MAG: four helix bundle protein [Bacteroidota bacterium]|nr:four helix bundle protein [Bacteroidota bacterium]